MYVIEVNPRSSRTVPYISKVTGIPIVPLASKVIIGNKIKELGYTPGLQPEADYVAVKMPVFSFEKIRGADISLGPEMKSTGECLGIAKTFDEALYKAFLGAGIKLPKFKNMIMTVRDEDKPEAVEIGRRFEKIGYRIFATKSTAEALNAAGVKAIPVRKIEQESPNLLDLILGHEIDLVIDQHDTCFRFHCFHNVCSLRRTSAGILCIKMSGIFSIWQIIDKHGNVRFFDTSSVFCAKLDCCGISDHIFSSITCNMIVHAKLQRLQKSGLPMVSASHDQRDPFSDSHSSYHTSVRQRNFHFHLLWRPETNCAFHRTGGNA